MPKITISSKCWFFLIFSETVVCRADFFCVVFSSPKPSLGSRGGLVNCVVSSEARCQADQRVSPQERRGRRSFRDRWRSPGRRMLTGPVYSRGPGGPGGPSHPCGHCGGHGGQGQVRGVGGCNWSLSSLKCPGWIAFDLEGFTFSKNRPLCRFFHRVAMSVYISLCPLFM